MPASPSPLLELLDFSIRGITILKASPTAGWRVVAGPYFEHELAELGACLRNHRGGMGMHVNAGGITVYRRA